MPIFLVGNVLEFQGLGGKRYETKKELIPIPAFRDLCVALFLTIYHQSVNDGIFQPISISFVLYLRLINRVNISDKLSDIYSIDQLSEYSKLE